MTLLELMVTAGILVVAITGLLSAFVSSFLLNVANNNKSIAATDAQFLLESLQSSPYSELISHTNTSFSNLPDETIYVTVTTGSETRNIEVNVTWMERGQERSFEIVSRRAL
jgi:Tfp pilus assembly protein PilV